MERLLMKNGEYEFIRDKEDFFNLVKKCMGEDSVEYLKELITNQIEILEEFEEKLDDLQEKLEDCGSCIDDLKNEIAELKS
jgi:tRNA(Phe) wybutosine-synthesizing methylase Tyw3